ncbi:MAG: peptidoglycan DD-metalloendopeptidase family protein [Patescibacteria group bacterium]|nr:peptidoglycan DD-metalloendopeptidase family protein [Patescibacteria group bacterium]
MPIISRMYNKRFSILAAAAAGVFLVTALVIFGQARQTQAETAEELQAKIDQHNQDIASLEQDIKNYQGQIDSLSSQASSLSATLRSLDLNRRELEAKISLTENQIAAKNLEIEQLGSQIGKKQGNIDDDRRIVRQTFMALEENSGLSLIDIFLGSNTITDAISGLDRLAALQNNVYDRIHQLSSDKVSLVSSQQASEAAKADLLALNSQLSDQRSIVLQTANAKNTLLAQTNQSESSYAKLLADTKAQELELQQEINSYELQLHLLVNPSQIPPSGSGVLSWPLDSIRITQYFGNTPFATANPQLYSGMGHDGVDFAASIGTPVKAALSGVVIGVENTDLYPGCYSFGKWIMIKHANGLSTLYAHLSLQSVHVGQQVSTGQLIGYTGNTGYTTGPHLHFGVYATAGTVIRKFTTSKHCQGAIIPLADFSAYLNPLSYL